MTTQEKRNYELINCGYLLMIKIHEISKEHNLSISELFGVLEFVKKILSENFEVVK